MHFLMLSTTVYALSTILSITDAGASTNVSPLLLSDLVQNGHLQQAKNRSQINETLLQQYHPDLNTSGFVGYSGYFTVDQTLGNHLFFCFFHSTTNTSAPLVLWLNGGPSLSSMFGLFWENGPWELRQGESGNRWKISQRNTTWVGPFSMLYIDNPAGVGFSYSDSGRNGWKATEEGYTSDLFNFITQFYTMFPEYSARELYIGGQSYAGKYVPSLAYRIHEKKSQGLSTLPLAGIYLGGPYFDPFSQGEGYYEFSFSLGFISKAQRDQKVNGVRNLKHRFENGVANKPDIYEILTVLFSDVGFDSLHNMVTQENEPDASLGALMNNGRWSAIFHTGNRTFIPYSMAYHIAFQGDFLTNRTQKMATLLNNYKVLIYNGDYDVATSSLAVEKALIAVQWQNQTNYKDSDREIWRHDDKLQGFFTRIKSLCRVVVHGAGHQTPKDQPNTCLDMMKDFIHHGCIREN